MLAAGIYKTVELSTRLQIPGTARPSAPKYLEVTATAGG